MSLVSGVGFGVAGSSGGGGAAAAGQAFYGQGEGATSWTCPPGVTSVCVVCIGGGAGNQGGATSSGHGGGGAGGLGWKNNIAVTPGNVYVVQMGKGGDMGYGNAAGWNNGRGGDSFFIDAATVCGFGGQGYTGGTYTGDGGGNGGAGGSSQAGGGAGGYTGNGTDRNINGAATGGAATGGRNYSSTWGWSSGGGVGPWGQGVSGSAPPITGSGGVGGSGGENGVSGENGQTSRGHTTRNGGLYGGGAGGCGDNSYFPQSLQKGGRGCVRIIWGAGRLFPSTGTGDM